ncbi:MAG: hypothetical protein WBN66_09760, partial [Smithella sp.]
LFQILITLFPRKINYNSAIFFNFQRASSMFTRLPGRIFQDGLTNMAVSTSSLRSVSPKKNVLFVPMWLPWPKQCFMKIMGVIMIIPMLLRGFLNTFATNFVAK